MENRMIMFIIFSAVMGILAVLSGIKIWFDGYKYTESEAVIEIIKQVSVKAVFVCIIYFIFM